jgi:hypothetical protein
MVKYEVNCHTEAILAACCAAVVDVNSGASSTFVQSPKARGIEDGGAWRSGALAAIR